VCRRSDLRRWWSATRVGSCRPVQQHPSAGPRVTAVPQPVGGSEISSRSHARLTLCSPAFSASMDGNTFTGSPSRRKPLNAVDRRPSTAVTQRGSTPGGGRTFERSLAVFGLCPRGCSVICDD
jgi:hypothetical protein